MWSEQGPEMRMSRYQSKLVPGGMDATTRVSPCGTNSRCGVASSGWTWMPRTMTKMTAARPILIPIVPMTGETAASSGARAAIAVEWGWVDLSASARFLLPRAAVFHRPPALNGRDGRPSGWGGRDELEQESQRKEGRGKEKRRRERGLP